LVQRLSSVFENALQKRIQYNSYYDVRYDVGVRSSGEIIGVISAIAGTLTLYGGIEAVA